MVSRSGVPPLFLTYKFSTQMRNSYLRQMSAKYIEMTEKKKKKDKYLQPCLYHRRTFTPMVYSADGIPGTVAISAQQHLALLLSNIRKCAAS